MIGHHSPYMVTVMKTYIPHDPHTTIYNSETNASELIENLEEIFLRFL